MAGTRIDGAKGVNTTRNGVGTSVERNNQNKGFYPFQVDSTQTFSSNTTLLAGDAGVNIVSSSGTVLTMSLPSASACPGAMWVFRAGSTQAHVLTGSHANSFVITGAFGSKLTFGSTLSSSVALQSDGNAFIVLNWTTNCNITTG